MPLCCYGTTAKRSMLLDQKVPVACVQLSQVALNRLPCSSAKTLSTDLTKIAVGSKHCFACILINHWGALQSCRHSFFQVMMEPLSTQPNNCCAMLRSQSNIFTLIHPTKRGEMGPLPSNRCLRQHTTPKQNCTPICSGCLSTTQ